MMTGEGGWYYVDGNNQTIGPIGREELVAAVRRNGPQTLLWGPGVAEWTEARHIAFLGATAG